MYVSMVASQLLYLSMFASMANRQFITPLLFALILARVQFSASHVLKGSVACLDCNAHFDLSDIKIAVKCSQVKKLAMATTEENGTFETQLPSDSPTVATPPSSSNCLARIVGGSSQLYASRKDMVSTTVKVPKSDSYTISTPLKFYKSCPLSKKDSKCRGKTEGIGSSKTIDVPLPPEWGFAPSSYYFPFVPIIGIP